MNKNEQQMQESLFDEGALNDGQKEEEQVQEASQEVSQESSSNKKESGPSASAAKADKPKERAGTILKREREAQGISLQIVHEAVKIPMDALRAIEEGYTVRTLSPFYYQGFVKMYAGYLGMDISEVIEDYKEEELPEHIDQDVEMGEFQIFSWIASFFTRRRKRKIVIAIGIFLALFLFVKMVGLVGKLFSRSSVKKSAGQTQIVKKETGALPTAKTERQKKAKREKVKPLKTVAPKSAEKTRPKVQSLVKPKTASEPTPKPTAVVSVATSVPAALLSKVVTLTVRAKQNSWLRVKADGNVVFQSTLRLGAVETWAADEEIEISGKNINQLEFELNGKMIGTLGRKDRNAKKVIITKNGLSVQN